MCAKIIVWQRRDIITSGNSTFGIQNLELTITYYVLKRDPRIRCNIFSDTNFRVHNQRENKVLSFIIALILIIIGSDFSPGDELKSYFFFY